MPAKGCKKTKRARLAQNAQKSASVMPASTHDSLTSLPIEILAEILLCTGSPPTVLAVSRTCSFLYHTLAKSPAVSFIWRGVRQSYSPCLPDPGQSWKGSEADYCAFVFGGGVCEVCGRTTRAFYVSFAARIRLCGSWFCRRKILDEIIVNVSTTLYGTKRQSIWAPYVESNLCFSSFVAHPSTWPHNDTVLFRKADFEKFKHELAAYKTAEAAEALCKHTPEPVSPSAIAEEEDEGRERLMARCHAAMQRFPEIMEVSARLIKWRSTYDQLYRTVKLDNKGLTRALAAHEGWDLDDLVASQTYGSLVRRKNYLLEHVNLNDVSAIRSVIESELLAVQGRHKRQKAEANYREKLTEVKKIYERMRCGTLHDAAAPTDSAGAWILPPLSVFCTLPSVRALKGSPDPSVVPSTSTFTKADIQSSPLTTSLIVSDLHTWLAPVQKHLMGLLGYPNGWQSASTRTVPPLQRVTARFFCGRCGEGKVGKGYQRELCLDLRGVCSHVCVAAQKKGGQGRQEALEEAEADVVDSDDGDGQEEKGGARKKKTGGVKTLDWRVDVFKKDERATRLVETVLKLTGLSDDDPSTASALKERGPFLRCMTCQGWVVMDFDTAIGHAHRHASMEIQMPFTKEVLTLMDSLDQFHIPSALRAFERGMSELLLGPSHRARNLCKKVNYGCRHCFRLVGRNHAGDLVVVERPEAGRSARAMDFNGLRSHVKEKHGIQDIRDEDFFCYESIQDQKGAKG